MGMTIDEAIERFKSNSKYERKHGNLQGCLEFAQLVDWLSKYQKIEQIVKEWREVGLEYDSCDAMMNIERVIEDGKTD